MTLSSLRELRYGPPERMQCRGCYCNCPPPYGFGRKGNKICWSYGPNGATLEDMIAYDFRTRCFYNNLPPYKEPPPSLGNRLRDHVLRILAKKTAMRDLDT